MRASARPALTSNTSVVSVRNLVVVRDGENDVVADLERHRHLLAVVQDARAHGQHFGLSFVLCQRPAPGMMMLVPSFVRSPV